VEDDKLTIIKDAIAERGHLRLLNSKDGLPPFIQPFNYGE